MRGSKRGVWVAIGAIAAVGVTVLLLAWGRKPKTTGDGDDADGRTPGAAAAARGSASGHEALRVARAAAKRGGVAATASQPGGNTSGGAGGGGLSQPGTTPAKTVPGMAPPPTREAMQTALARARVRVGKLDAVLTRVRSKANKLQLEQIQRQRDYFAHVVQALTQKLAETPEKK